MNETLIHAILRRELQRMFLALLLTLFGLSPQLLHAQGLPGEGEGWSYPTNLNSWTFGDTNTWLSDEGYAPISFTNISGSLMGNIGNGGSVLVDHPDVAWLRYNVNEADGATNLTVAVGSVALWVAPHEWASATTNQNGSGPGDAGRLLEVGAYTENATYGWWSLLLDAGGTNVYFAAQTNSGDSATVAYLSAPIDWGTNHWHNVVLTYSATNTSLYLDGELAASGPGVSVFPGPEVLTNGFWIGSDGFGLSQARCLFDDVRTYDVPLDAVTVATIYNYERPFYSINIFNVPVSIGSAPSEPVWVPEFSAITGMGQLQWLGAASGCETNSEFWITEISSGLTGAGLNLSAMCAFTIMGGPEGGQYDVFANAALGANEPAHQWAWMGRGYTCNSYLLSNLPPRSAFLILGSVQDSDFDGLTDAYELLVSHTDPDYWDSNGDGVSDGIAVLEGRNPNAPGAVADAGGLLAFDIFTPLE